MPSRTLPGLGLNAFWDEGDPWKLGGDQNWMTLSTVTQLAAISATSDLPTTPVDGDIYLVPSTAFDNPSEIAIRDNGAWVYISPKRGWLAHVEDSESWLEFDGAEWKDHTGALAKLAGAKFTGPVAFKPLAIAEPDTIGEVLFEMTSDTQLKIKAMGSDGIVRSVSLTLA